MTSTASRLWIAAALISAGWFCTSWVRAGYRFEVQPLSQPLSNVPQEVAGYTSQEVPLDVRVEDVLQADETLSRVYLRSDSPNVMVHISQWMRPETMTDVAPHSPKVCYTNSGWSIVDEQRMEIDSPAGRFPLQVLTLKQGEDQCVVAYWYQMGDNVFCTSQEARQIHREHWGRSNWPSTIKFLIEISPSTSENAREPLEKFASALFAWSREH